MHGERGRVEAVLASDAAQGDRRRRHRLSAGNGTGMAVTQVVDFSFLNTD
jgi:hypothetical protein